MKHLILAAAALLMVLSARPTFAAERPNVVIVLVDDAGYGDFSCLGSPILRTPQIDHFHDQSIRLTDFHVSPMCTPTRSQLMSGRDALDNGAMNVSAGRSMLRLGIPTLGDAFSAAGYRTGSFGKWHMGDVYPFRPQDRGFQSAIWFPSSHISSAPDHWNNDYFDPFFRQADGSTKQFKGYCTDVLFDQAMQYMTQSSADHLPFFVYLPLNAAHAPLYVPDKYREPYRNLDKNVASFYAMIANIDENMGKLDAFLQKSNLADNTIVIFLTDNGGTYGVPIFNAGMKGQKISLFEGGHRVPCFLRFPSGNLGTPRDIDGLTEVQDLFPTLLDLCRIPTPAGAKFSGIDLANILRGSEQPPGDRTLVIQFSRMTHTVPREGDAAVLFQRWRLLNNHELYDLSNDPTEDHDVAAAHPDIVAKLQKHYSNWWAAIAPTVNTFSAIPIGVKGEPIVLLSPADWHDVTLDQQREVRKGVERNGPWSLDVKRAGNYRFELRRYPREADAALTAALPAFKGVDGELPAGKPLPIAAAKFRIANAEFSYTIKPDDKSVIFDIPLRAGPADAQSWFLDAAGKSICGAYYVYVSRQ